MPQDEELTFADHVGRFYARRYGYPPMVGRVLGYLLVCDPKDRTIAREPARRRPGKVCHSERSATPMS